MSESISILNLQREVVRWADEVLPERTPHGALTKLSLEEVPELHKKFLYNGELDESELADCMILLLDLFAMADVNVTYAVVDKLHVNRNRNWTIKEGVLKHV